MQAARLVAAGDFHTCAVTADGKLHCFGCNKHGHWDLAHPGDRRCFGSLVVDWIYLVSSVLVLIRGHFAVFQYFPHDLLSIMES